MQFFSLAALAAATLLSTGAVAEDATTSQAATLTKTISVYRVVETVTATRNGSVSTYESTSTSVPTTLASATGAMNYNNATSSVLGAGATPTAAAHKGAAASNFGLESAGLAAIAGLVGLAFF